MRNKYTKEQLEKIVKESKSISECLTKMGCKPLPGNYRTFYRYKELYDLDISHFSGKGYNKGNRAHNYRSVYEYKNIKGLTVKGSVLLKKLIDEGCKEYKCECCNRTEWNGVKIPLQIHHIDGHHLNNDISNLQLLCPNCHALTENYCGKNNSNYKGDLRCKDCGCLITTYSRSGLCVQCEHKQHYRCQHPDKETLLQLLQQGNFTSVAKIYGVTDNSVRKWCKGYGMPTNASAYK